MRRKDSPPITADIAAIAKRAMLSGLYQHQIASVLGVNQGRISEIKTGKIFADVSPAPDLPAWFN